MKKLKDELSLVGKIEKISMMELRSSPGEVMTQVSIGKVFIIQRNEEPIAVLSRVPGQQLGIVVDKKGKRSYELVRSIKWEGAKNETDKI